MTTARKMHRQMYGINPTQFVTRAALFPRLYCVILGCWARRPHVVVVVAIGRTFYKGHVELL